MLSSSSGGHSRALSIWPPEGSGPQRPQVCKHASVACTRPHTLDFASVYIHGARVCHMVSIFCCCGHIHTWTCIPSERPLASPSTHSSETTPHMTLYQHIRFRCSSNQYSSWRASSTWPSEGSGAHKFAGMSSRRGACIDSHNLPRSTYGATSPCEFTLWPCFVFVGTKVCAPWAHGSKHPLLREKTSRATKDCHKIASHHLLSCQVFQAAAGRVH